MSRILQEVNYANVDIIINNIVHSDVDFQTEGAVALAIRLLEKMFNLDESEIDVQFDHDLNRYTFPWDLSKLGSFWLD
ncbi:hypothetical protein GCM10022198_11500 [Klugiella xanthotipulae]|uniref:Uncharacterized protein n=2 Tax=Klugiella xanthotipulae TaxID=244735 RepID=A0A543HYZ0_9MICO|nr:hypothetical protein FB466_1807 [Klugiella xanthotipulae]